MYKGCMGRIILHEKAQTSPLEKEQDWYYIAKIVYSMLEKKRGC